MATKTIKIKEKTKAGRTFLNLIEIFTETYKEIEIVPTPNDQTLMATHNAKNGNIIDAPSVEELLKILKS